jgi:plasmid stabilization system protein ParE
MDVEIHPEAEDELNEQAAYYEYEAAGLGVVYLRTFDSTLNLVAELPEIAPVWRDVYRRFAMRRFPQSLFYFIDDQTVFVVAVAHDRRLPGYWLQRRF